MRLYGQTKKKDNNQEEIHNKKEVMAKKAKAKKSKTVKDSCYYAAKRAHKVFPSAYASGMIAKCRKKKASKKKK